MNENTKTISFLSVAGLLLAIGVWISLPSRPGSEIDEIGQKFFPDFNALIGDQNKVEAIAGAEIAEVSAETSVPRSIKVQRIDGAWRINPVKQGYPDMSVGRLADVVKSLRDLKKLDISSTSQADHRRYGVVDPTDLESLKAGADGVGKLVTIQDAAGSALVKLIVGRKDEKKPSLSFVREPGKDVVYLTEIDPSPLSTRFEDWVQLDLLDEASGDMRAVGISDHAVDAEMVRQVQGIFEFEGKVAKATFKSEAELKKDEGDQWSIARFETFNQAEKKFSPWKPADDEVIDTAKLASLQGALGRIKVVDAVKKSPLLAQDLAGETNFLTNPKSDVRRSRESIFDLQRHGFKPERKAEGSQEYVLVNHEGDMKAGFADGVEFMLRFGDITGRGQADPAKGDEGAKAADGKPADGAAAGGAAESTTAPGRFLMVTAAFNPNLVPKPRLQVLPPEDSATTPASEEKKPEGKKTEENTPAEKKSEGDAAVLKDAESKDSAPKEASPKDGEPAKVDPKTDAAPSGSCDDQEPERKEPEGAGKPTGSPSATAPTATASSTAPSSTAAPPAASPSATKPAATPTATAKQEEKKPEETKPAETKPAETKPMTPEERKRITAANKQAQTTYDDQLKAGREKAERLNKKFADWYYVISAATYNELNVDPLTLVKKKSEAPPPAGPPGGLPPGFNNMDIQRMLQQQQQQQQGRP
jgi:hypothetical protein